MDLKDMILVTENDRGTETNMLMTLDDYKSFIAIDDMSFCVIGTTEIAKGDLYGAHKGSLYYIIQQICGYGILHAFRAMSIEKAFRIIYYKIR